MKTLNELIDVVRECDKESFEATQFNDNQLEAQNAYQSGYSAACSVLIPALKEAVKGLAEWPCGCYETKDGYREPCVRCQVEATIQSLLSGKKAGDE